LYHSKKFLIPMLVFADYELPAVAASYLLTGRFNPEREFEKHPAGEENNPDARRPEKAPGKEQAHVVGTSEEWKRYRQELNSLLKERVHTENEEQGDVQHLFKHLNKVGTPRVDVDGALWIEIRDKEQTFEVGLSANNILGQNSNPQLAYSLLLWRAHGVLKSPKHGRETMPEFERDWELLQRARLKNAVVVAGDGTPDKSICGAGGGND
jgi:hypothetical protein